jgi:hypothetical protein
MVLANRDKVRRPKHRRDGATISMIGSYDE